MQKKENSQINNDELDHSSYDKNKVDSKLIQSVFQFFRFGLIGAFNTLLDLFILNFLMFISSLTSGAPYAGFKAVSFSFAAISSYFLNKNWAFKDKSIKNQRLKFFQFLAISIIGGIINVSIATFIVSTIKPLAINSVWLLEVANSIHPILGKYYILDQFWGNIGALGGTAIGLIWNFTGYKLIVFKK